MAALKLSAHQTEIVASVVVECLFCVWIFCLVSLQVVSSIVVGSEVGLFEDMPFHAFAPLPGPPFWLCPPPKWRGACSMKTKSYDTVFKSGQMFANSAY